MRIIRCSHQPPNIFHYLHHVKACIIFLGILFLVACSDIQKPEYLEKIKQLGSEVEAITEISENIDVDSIHLLINQIENVESRIKKNYQDDTLNLLLVEKLDAYKRIHPNLSIVSKLCELMEGAIDLRVSSLEGLKNDIENSAGKRSEYGEYIEQEKTEIGELKRSVNYCDSVTKTSFKTFNTLHPEIEKFSFELELKNKE